MINQRLKLNVSIKERRNNMSDSMYDLLFIIDIMSNCVLSVSIMLYVMHYLMRNK